MRENVKHDDELEELLDEIPQATSRNLLHHHHRHRQVYGADDTQAIHGMYGMYDDGPLTEVKYPCASSPVSDLSLLSDGPSSSSFSYGYSFPENGSSTPSPFEELKFNMSSSVNPIYPNSFWLDSKTPDLPFRKKDNESLVDELGLCDNLSKMYVSNQRGNFCNLKDASIGINRLSFGDCLDGNNQTNGHKHGDYDNFKREYFNCVGVQSPFPRSPVSPMSPDSEISSTLSGYSQEHKMANLFGSQQCLRRPCTMVSQLNDFSGSMDSLRHTRQMINNCCYRGSMAPEFTASLSGHPTAHTLPYAQQSGLNLMEERGVLSLPNSSPHNNLGSCLSAQNNKHQLNVPLSNARAMRLSNARIPQAGLDAISSEGSFIIQGEGLNYVISRGFDCGRGQSKGASRGPRITKHIRRSELDIHHPGLGAYENPRSARIDYSFPLLPKYNTLADAQGFIYLLAIDQQGCRFLQRIFDEGTPEDVQEVFNEVINHVVELMINPFGNYLVQKLLDVCNEEQRTHILLMVTEQPGQLVRISLNIHGTRVVQKMIETLKTRRQISLVVSALEPGFLALIKDLNGNHVIQRCLQFLSIKDNMFIFLGATKYCIEIATHQHGCCVLQRCISHSSGERQESLVAEISANALMLAQNQFGNYVVQFILDLRIPHATASIISQFEGNYVHLSMEKFSSHVVEKCLAVFNDKNRSRLICELLSAPHFAQLLQDPHANYVIQTALRHSEGHVHNSLVEAVESHKVVLRNSPYSKKIFSQKLLKK